jgi:hypothetical protein
VSDLRKRYARLLRVYPRSYREQRGEEMLATLLETSTGTHHSDTRDAADVLIHAVQMRLGLTTERFAGRVLDVAATPGLALAAAFSIYFFVFVELFRFIYRSYGLTGAVVNGRWSYVVQTHFGPFSTTGILIYLGWILVAAGALVWPFHRRSFAAFGVGVTVLAMALGKLFFAAPRAPLMLVIVALALPAVLAPRPDYARNRFGSSAVAAVALLALLWWRSGPQILNEALWYGRGRPSFGSLYAGSVYDLGTSCISSAY